MVALWYKTISKNQSIKKNIKIIFYFQNIQSYAIVQMHKTISINLLSDILREFYNQ